MALVDHGAGDAELVAQAKIGDAEAFTLLYRRYVHQIHAFTFDKLGSVAAAEEATQIAFFHALRSLDRYQETGQFRGWLFRIAERVCVNQWRSAGRTTLPLDAAVEQESPDPLPEERAIVDDGIRALRRARQECLSERDRRLYDLVVQELTHQEIAHVLGKRAGAVRMAHTRLVDRLRVCLGILTNLRGGRHAAS